MADLGHRDQPWARVPTLATFQRATDNGEPVIALIVDHPNNRNVSFWTDAEFRRLLEGALEWLRANPPLHVANMGDLARIIPPPGPNGRLGG